MDLSRPGKPSARTAAEPGERGRGSVASPRSSSTLLRWAVRAVVGIFVLALVLGLSGFLWIHHSLKGSLPLMSGRLAASRLIAPVRIERDDLGVPTLLSRNRRDAAFALGFVHAQDRFFQMDLLRRRAAGELAELLGPRLLPRDRVARRHLFRERARRVLDESAPDVRELLASYTAGANAGLEALAEAPFEYLVLRVRPRPWTSEDSVLVLFTMFSQLEDIDGRQESSVSLMHDRLPTGLFRFLTPEATEWDAPISGQVPPSPAPPSASEFDTRRESPQQEMSSPIRTGALTQMGPRLLASSSWAVSGRLTENGEALLANDLHLDLTVPNIWYRASMSWPAGGVGNPPHVITGATLPGTPAVVVGSNGSIAWSLTNSGLDTSDLILLEEDPDRPGFYDTPSGPRTILRRREMLRVKGRPAEPFTVEWTLWGPVLGRDGRGRLRVVHSMADQDGAADFEILGLESARGVDEALQIAKRSGLPALNFVAVDRSGRIGWTVAGRLPHRVGFSGRFASSWADGTHRWQGFEDPSAIPQVVDPPSGRLWTANNRVFAGDVASLEHGEFALGARARQIRDDLATLSHPTIADMRGIQLDDRALFLTRWHDLLVRVLSPDALAADARRKELRDLVAHWDGHASVDSAGYRMVHAFRYFVARDAFEPLTASCREVDPDFDYLRDFAQAEGPLWHLVTQRPENLRNPKYRSWGDQMLSAADEVIDLFTRGGASLADRTWGERNVVRIEHPLSAGLPLIGRWLSMPPRELPGDDYMPRLQEPDFGATLRIVVSPGHEGESIYEVPGGESGNPLSVHYKDSFDAWADGDAAPFLPGDSRSTLVLVPRDSIEGGAGKGL